jgi:hypothetical protein
MIFVTALFDICETRADRGLEMRVSLFQKLADTGIRLHVFVDNTYGELLKNARLNGVVESIDFTTLETYKRAPPGIPDYRNDVKDTRAFMLLMNAKLEFVKRCMDKTNSSHYAWIDASVFHVLSEGMSHHLQTLEKRTYPLKCLYFPGCTGPGVVTWDHINWRFCGGFFLGDRASLNALYEAYIRAFPNLPKLCWEVNVWAYLETIENHKFDWFVGNHDDSLLAIP